MTACLAFNFFRHLSNLTSVRKRNSWNWIATKSFRSVRSCQNSSVVRKIVTVLLSTILAELFSQPGTSFLHNPVLAKRGSTCFSCRRRRPSLSWGEASWALEAPSIWPRPAAASPYWRRSRASRRFEYCHTPRVPKAWSPNFLTKKLESICLRWWPMHTKYYTHASFLLVYDQWSHVSTCFYLRRSRQV